MEVPRSCFEFSTNSLPFWILWDSWRVAWCLKKPFPLPLAIVRTLFFPTFRLRVGPIFFLDNKGFLPFMEWAWPALMFTNHFLPYLSLGCTWPRTGSLLETSRLLNQPYAEYPLVPREYLNPPVGNKPILCHQPIRKTNVTLDLHYPLIITEVANTPWKLQPASISPDFSL